MTPQFRLMLMVLAVIGQIGLFADEASSNDALQIYGLTLDGTRWGERFCEAKDARLPVPQAPDCLESAQTLPRIHHVQTETAPSPHVIVHFETPKGSNGETLQIWYAPPGSSEQSFMIETRRHSTANLAGTRQAVIEAYGQPTLEFTHDDIEAKGLNIYDLTLGVLIFTDPTLSNSVRGKMADQLKEDFDPTAEELFGLPGSSIEDLARLLGADFRGAVVQIAESGFGHESSVHTLLVDLRRAQTVFTLRP